MSTRSALVSCADDATTEALTRRLTGDGVRVTVADPTDPAAAVAGLGSLDALV